jgi:L-lysine 2,3-aminomutase
MGVSDILASVDREIALLKQVRALLSGTAVATPKKKAVATKHVAPAVASAIQSTAETVSKKRRKKRKLSPEGRKRIAEAVKRRWEAQRKAAATSK